MTKPKALTKKHKIVKVSVLSKGLDGTQAEVATQDELIVSLLHQTTQANQIKTIIHIELL